MRNSPIIGILLSVIVVLFIIIVSLGSKISASSRGYSQEINRRISMEETMDELEKELLSVKAGFEDIKSQLKDKEALIITQEASLKELSDQIKKLNELNLEREKKLKNDLAEDR